MDQDPKHIALRLGRELQALRDELAAHGPDGLSVRLSNSDGETKTRAAGDWNGAFVALAAVFSVMLPTINAPALDEAFSHADPRARMLAYMDEMIAQLRNGE